MSDIDTKFNRRGRNDDVEDLEVENPLKNKLEVFKPLGRPLGRGVPLNLSLEEFDQIHLYILQNCDELIEFVK